MYTPNKFLSSNTKTGCSLNLPIKGHCRPTELCYKDCYAKKGPIAWGHSNKKQVFVSEYLKGNDLSKLIYECRQRTAVRLCGSGDLLMEHIPNILKMAKGCSYTQFWGMTRKIEIARALNGKMPNLKLLLSIDKTTPKKDLRYKGKMCYGPVREDEKVPDFKRIVTVFPYHFAGKIVGNIKRDKRDCPAVRHEVNGCLDCGKCWNWS